MKFTIRRFVIGPNDAGRRLDRILKALLPDMPLALIYRLLRDGGVRVFGKKTDGAYRVSEGDTLDIRLADTTVFADSIGASSDTVALSGAAAAESRRFAAMILLETPDIVVVNKPRGVLTHGEGGLDVAVKAYFAEKMASSLAFMPAPLHRLDRNTSGAVAVSASIRGATAFSAALRTGLIRKSYLALLQGDLPAEARWSDELSRDTSTRISSVMPARPTRGDYRDETDDAPSGLKAEAVATPLVRAQGFTLAAIRLETGRTHQIRAQAASRGVCLAGDLKYGAKPFPGGYVLHCAVLEMPAGVAEAGLVRVVAPLPSEAIRALETIFGDDFQSHIDKQWLQLD